MRKPTKDEQLQQAESYIACLKTEIVMWKERIARLEGEIYGLNKAIDVFMAWTRTK